MASSIRSRRTTIAAAAVSLALVAPLTATPQAPFSVAVASAATDPKVFDDTYETENFWGKDRVQVLGLQLTPGDKVVARFVASVDTRDTAPKYEVDSAGNLFILKPKANIKPGLNNFDVFLESPGGTRGKHVTLKVNVSNSDDSWAQGISGFDSVHTVDFGKDKTKPLEAVKIPEGASVTVKPAEWGLKVMNGATYISASPTFKGSGEPVELDVTLSKDNHTETRKLSLLASKEQAEVTGTAGTILGILGPLLGNLIPGLGGGGGAGGGGGLLNGLFDGLVRIDIHDNNINATVENNGNNNTGVATDAIHDNGVVQPGAVSVPVEIKDNVGMQSGAVNIPVEVKDNVGVAPSGVNVNAEVQPSAVVVTDNAKIEPSGVIVTNNANVLPNVGTKKEGNGAAGAGKDSGSSNGLDNKCKASLIGFGVPLAVLTPILLINVFRIPGFEGAQEAMKGFAASLPKGLNISQEQLAAGVGGFTGLFTIAGIITTLVNCLPKKNAEPAPSTDASAPSSAPSTVTDVPSAPAAPSAPANEPSAPAQP